MTPPDRHAGDLPTDLDAPARRALAAAGYRTLAQLTVLTERDLGRLHGVGPKAIGRLRRALQEQGLAFATEDDQTRPG